MIGVLNLLFMADLKNRKPVDQNKLADYVAELSTFRYPACKFPYNIIQNNLIYSNYSLQENLEYFDTWLTALYEDMYTEEEIEVLKLYAVLMYDNVPCYLSNTAMEMIEPYLNVHFEKQEIEFFLDELRYNYLGTLLYSNSQDTETIDSLISQLRAIENDHNIFQYRMDTRQDES